MTERVRGCRSEQQQCEKSRGGQRVVIDEQSGEEGQTRRGSALATIFTSWTNLNQINNSMKNVIPGFAYRNLWALVLIADLYDLHITLAGSLSQDVTSPSGLDATWNLVFIPLWPASSRGHGRVVLCQGWGC